MSKNVDQLLTTIRETIRSNDLFCSDSPVVLMVSGGSDSTGLAYVMEELRREKLVGSLAIMHVNHMLRGVDADRDERFVHDLADSLGIPFFPYHIDVRKIAESHNDNLEAVGRNERYIAAHEVCRTLCERFAVPVERGRIVTAHTQDDRVENFYMRSIVGTGPGGFRSMRYKNGIVTRPVLDVSRDDLRAYIESLPDNIAVIDSVSGKRWREDETNADTDYFRAFVRHEIVPKAKSRNSKMLDTLCRSMNLIADEDDYLSGLAEDLVREYVRWDTIDYNGHLFDTCMIMPDFGKHALVLRRRAVFAVLDSIMPKGERVKSSSVETVLSAFDESGVPRSGFVANIQGDFAVSSNKRGVRVEPMTAFRVRRKR